MAAKRVLVACGTGIATSTVVVNAIEEGMRERGIDVQIRQCTATEVPSLAPGMDLVVATTPVPTGHGVPVIQTIAFLTGIGREDVLNQIASVLRGS